ncbi:thioredoxin-like protein [Xylariomycetidae sp. FL0641]|nr:thioredoxin-like protein [Xylariomycetidae sp. FL0641]
MSTFSLRAAAQATTFLRRSAVYTKPATFAPFRQFTTTKPNMTVHNLATKADFEEAVKNNKMVVLDCFATWCGPCKAIAPIYANLSNDEANKDVFFAKIDVDEMPEVAQELGVTSMPTFLVFKDGKLEPADKLPGANPNALTEMVKKNNV